MPVRRPLRAAALLAVATTALGSVLVAPGPLTPVASARAELTRTLPLPDGFQPEGIATDGRHTAYLGSRVSGDIYRLDLTTGLGRTISRGPGTPSLGMKLDDRGRLFVAGGTGGDARVVDVGTGRVKRTYQLSFGTSFVNDVFLTKGAAWLTDSAAPQLYRLPFKKRTGNLPPAGRVETLPLTGAWTQVTGNNANGLTTTPDGRAILVVNSADGTLHRVDPDTGITTLVDLGTTRLTNGDGLLREGRRLFVVQNRLNRIAVVRLARDGRSGSVLPSITSAAFDVPSTVARSRGRLFLPNARFTTPAEPTTPYSVTGIKVRQRGR